MLKIRIYLTSIFSGFLGQLAFNLCMHRTSLCIPVHPKSLGIRIRIYLPINVKCPGPISTCKAQPAFEAYAFDFVNLDIQSFSQGELGGGSSLPIPAHPRSKGIIEF